MTEYKETEPECKREVIGKEISPGIPPPHFFSVFSELRKSELASGEKVHFPHR